MAYIQQDLFDMMAVSAAFFAAITEDDIQHYSKILAQNYTEYEDARLAEDTEEAAKKVTYWIENSFGTEYLAGNLNHLQYCIQGFNLEGKKREREYSVALFLIVKKLKSMTKLVCS